jgi:hypothetical protein
MKSSIFKIIFSTIVVLFGMAINTSAQNNALVLNGAYIKLNGGTSSTKIFLVVNQNNTAGISRSSGHIISENQYNYVRWIPGAGTGNYVYPFGYSTTDYLPVTINKTTATSISLDASTWGTDNKNQPHAGISDGGALPAVSKMDGVGDSISSVIDRWWDFYPSGALTANITFSYRGAENATTSNTTDNLDMQHWNGSSWDMPLTGSTTGVTSGVGTISVTGVSAFSPMVVIHRTGSLPVTFSEFDINCAQGGAGIRWTTASEKNSDYFSIEKSADGKTFQSVATVKAAGNSSMMIRYEWIDHNYSASPYYRIKEVDLDGKYMYSRVIFAACQMGEEQNINVYPNPASDFLNYNLDVEHHGYVSADILDCAGNVVQRERFSATPGMNISSLDVRTLSEGFYVLILHYDGKVARVKFIRSNQ